MIGALRQRLTLEQAVRTPDAGGGATLSWSIIATVWAAIAAVGGEEREASDRSDARTRFRVRLRYRTGISAEMRFRQGARLFNIRSIRDEDGHGRWLTCICEEGGAP